MLSLRTEENSYFQAPILALQTTYPNFASLAVRLKSKILEDNFYTSTLVPLSSPEKSYSEKLWDSLIKLLKRGDIKLEKTKLILVGVGPGSYTGSRIGTTLASGLALALNIEAKGISNLEALAYQALPCVGKIISILEAKRDQVYYEIFEGKENYLLNLSLSSILSKNEIPALIGKFKPSCVVVPAELYPSLLFLSSKVNLIGGKKEATFLIKLGEDKLRKKLPFLPPIPLYIRPPV
jgi:tRNA threonylcarbamoyladenosine biosynthesis protein TsaB